MTELSIPDAELNEFDLPRVCVVTGNTTDVVFKKVKFQWYPPWVGVFVLVNPIIFAIIATIMMKRSAGQLPFTEEAHAAWKRGQLALGLSIVGAVFTLIGGVALMANEQMVPGVLLLVLTLAVPIAVGVTMSRGRGPRVVRIKDGLTVIRVPSAQGAQAIAAHLSQGGRRAPGPVVQSA